MSDMFAGLQKTVLKGQNSKNEKEEKPDVEKKTPEKVKETKTTEVDNAVKVEKAETPIVKESPVKASEETVNNKRGRKPSENPMERDFISVNIGDGAREDLTYLCRRHEKQTGKKSVGLGTYIRYLIEKDIADNKKYLDAAKAFEKEFE